MNNIFERISNAITCLTRDKYVLVEVSPNSVASYSNRMNVSKDNWIKLTTGICDGQHVDKKVITVNVTDEFEYMD